MPLEEFDFVVLGDEPAGLWCLERLSQALGNGPAAPRLGWVGFRDDVPALPVPARLAPLFGLSTGPVWHAEIMTPSAGFPWRPDELVHRFPELTTRFFEPLAVDGEPRFPERDMSAVRSALRQRPELLAYASGIWKCVGRTRALHPERLIAGALLCAELAWWRPGSALDGAVSRVKLHPRRNPIEEIKSLRNGTISVRFAGMEPILSRHWILNAPWHQLAILDTRSGALLDVLNVADELRSAEGLLPLTLRLRRTSVPTPASPLTVWFSHDDIPDVAREIWPLELRPSSPEATSAELAIWTSVPRELDLDTALERLRDGLRRIHPLLPFLAEGILSFDTPLDMRSCHGDEQRDEALSDIECRFVEHYDYTSLHTEARLKGLSALLPSHRCDLPYPIGALLGAKPIVDDIIRRRSAPQSAKTTAAPTPSP